MKFTHTLTFVPLSVHVPCLSAVKQMTHNTTAVSPKAGPQPQSHPQPQPYPQTQLQPQSVKRYYPPIRDVAVPSIPTDVLPPQTDNFWKDILSNKGNIVTKALIGAAIGSTYALFENLTSKRMVYYRLHPDPKFFSIDPIMSQYFHRWAQWRDTNNEAYERALENTDRLFEHEYSIRSRQPIYGDKSLAKMWVMHIATDVYQFRIMITNPKVRAMFNILSRAILIRLLTHLANICRRVSLAYPKAAIIKEKMKRMPWRYACSQFRTGAEGSDEYKSQICLTCRIEYQYHAPPPPPQQDEHEPANQEPHPNVDGHASQQSQSQQQQQQQQPSMLARTLHSEDPGDTSSSGP